MSTPQQLYTSRALWYDKMTRLVRHRQALAQFLKRKRIVQSKQRILDAGCGSGALFDALFLAQAQQLLDIEVYGFDFTQNMLDLAKKSKLSNVQLIQADALYLAKSLPSEWKDFDLVLSSGMLEYIPPERLTAVLQELQRRLKPKGQIILFISRPSWFNTLFIGKYWQANLYAKTDIRSKLAAAGFLDIRIENFQSWGYGIQAYA